MMIISVFNSINNSKEAKQILNFTTACDFSFPLCQKNLIFSLFSIILWRKNCYKMSRQIVMSRPQNNKLTTPPLDTIIYKIISNRCLPDLYFQKENCTLY